MRLPALLLAGLAGTLVLTVSGAPPAPATTDRAGDRRVHPVGVRSETLPDPTRTTPAAPAVGIEASGSRIVPVTVWYPTRGALTTEPQPDAAPVKGRFPLIVYAPGNGARGADPPALVRSWAALGYVVAAIDFPVSSRAGANLAAIDDWANQPGDVELVIDEALDRDGIAGLHRTIDREHLGVAGHSLGAMTVLAVAFGDAPDARIDAVVTFAGVPLLGGADVSSRRVPLLLVHGEDDATIPAEQSRTMFADAAGPRALVLVAGGGHSPYLRAPDPEMARTLATATTTFWDATLRGRRTAGADPDARLLALARPGRYQVEVGPPPNLRARPDTR